jgi:hypothetical protein
VLIITDDENLMGVQPANKRIIFVTQKEYKKYNNLFRTDLEKISISPLFRVDNEKDTYKIRVNYNFHGTTYLVKKTKKGWVMEIISMHIS